MKHDAQWLARYRQSLRMRKRWADPTQRAVLVAALQRQRAPVPTNGHAAHDNGHHLIGADLYAFAALGVERKIAQLEGEIGTLRGVLADCLAKLEA